MSNQAPVTCIFGVRGTGKSTLARSLISDTPRVLAHDPFGEYAAVCVESVGQAAAYLDQLARSEERPSPVRYRVSVVGFIEDAERDRLCALAWVLGRRAPMTTILEEADQIAPPMREPRWLKRMIAQGRHAGISILAISRRPAEVSRLLTSQADTIYCFRTHEPRDVAYLRQVMGDSAERITRLRGHQYLRWTPISGESAASDGDQDESREVGRESRPDETGDEPESIMSDDEEA